MQKEIKKSWALFLGIGIMMIGHGLLMQIMGIRSVLEEFSVLTTGFIMSGYFVGYFIGSKTILLPKIWIGSNDKKLAESITNQNQIIAIAPGGNWNPKIWPIYRLISH